MFKNIRLSVFLTILTMFFMLLVGCSNTNDKANDESFTNMEKVIDEIGNDDTDDDADYNDDSDDVDDAMELLEARYLETTSKVIDLVKETLDDFRNSDTSDTQNWVEGARGKFDKIRLAGALMDKMQDDKLVPKKFSDNHEIISKNIYNIADGGETLLLGVEDNFNQNKIDDGMNVIRESVDNVVSEMYKMQEKQINKN